jgi:glycerophosphoryl diester phosphodiesterase
VLILAHRGASADAPENTLAAFREAAAQGADGVELDVMVCGSGELVVCHDERLDRLTGQDLEVRRTPLYRLRELDVGGRLGFGAFASIPTLEEVFAALPSHFLVNVELKCDRVGDDGLARLAGEYLSARPELAGRVIVSSFNPLCLLRLKRRFPKLRRGWLIDPDGPFWFESRFARPCANFSVHPHHAAITEPRVRRWRKAGYQVAAWTVDDPAEAARLRSLGVVDCITNRPRAVREALARG